MTVRWILAVLTLLGGFLIAGVAGAVTASLLGFWYLPGRGFCAAAVVVVVAYIAAPKHRFMTSWGVLALGAIAAWAVLEPSWLPESYAERGAYQPTHLPIIATYAGALVGLTVVALLHFRPARKTNP